MQFGYAEKREYTDQLHFPTLVLSRSGYKGQAIAFSAIKYSSPSAFDIFYLFVYPIISKKSLSVNQYLSIDNVVEINTIY